MSGHTENIINSLSAMILDDLAGASHEQYYPLRQADDMDDFIKQKKERANKLRKLREDFENIATGIL